MTTAVSNESPAVQMNFNPSWMRSAFHGARSQESGEQQQQQQQDYPLTAPVFVKHRYGREDLLALLDPEHSASPDGLDQCPFFMSNGQVPIVCSPLTELEQRLQQNINSSKAMSCIAHAERIGAVNTASGGGISPGVVPSTFTPAWVNSQASAATTGTSIGRGSGIVGRGGFRGGRGGGALVNSPFAEAPAGLGPRYVQTTVGRGGTRTVAAGAGGRGGGAASINQRAQGLYDPRDPRDRPRQRLRSTSDDAPPPPSSNIGGGGNGPSGWNNQGERRAAWKVGNDPQQTMPEWLEDSDDFSRDDSSETIPAGSFDENGQFRTSAGKKNDSDENISTKSLSPPTKENKTDNAHAQQHVMVKEENNKTSISKSSSGNVWQSIGDRGRTNSEEVFADIERNASSMIDSFSVEEDVIRPSPQPQPQPTNSQQQLSPRMSSIVPMSIRASDETWLYLDPQGTVRGPFETGQMQAWFSNGYFTHDLSVRRVNEKLFVKLGELVRLNGTSNPFKSSPSPPVYSRSHSATLPSDNLSNLTQSLAPSSSVWEEAFTSTSARPLQGNAANVQMFDVLKVQQERQRLEEEQRKLKDMQETMAREARERERQLQEQLMRQKAEHERQLMAERQRLAEEEQRGRQAMEQERLAAELRHKALLLEDQQRQIESNRLQETARKLAAEEAAERSRRQIEQEQEALKIAEQKKKQKQLAQQQQTASSQKLIVTELFTAVSKPSTAKYSSSSTSSDAPPLWGIRDDQTIGKAKETPKAAPWSSSSPSSTWQTSEGSMNKKNVEQQRSLIDIQREQEHQQKEHGRVQKASNRPIAVQSTESTGVWGGQRLQWGSGNNVNNVSSSPSPWGNKPHVEAISLWESDETNSTKRSGNSTSTTKSTVQRNKPASTNPSGDMPSKKLEAEQNALRKIFSPSTTTEMGTDPFIAWVTARVNQLNASVDAVVLAHFIEGVDSPHEIEDYVIGYLGESRPVKDFIREFLEKRSEMRTRRQLAARDDLSRAAAAAEIGQSSTTSANSGGGATAMNPAGSKGGKKKGRGKTGQKLVVDGSCLGFKPTADPNRINAGEIDVPQ